MELTGLTIRSTEEVLRYDDVKSDEQWNGLSQVEKNLIHFYEARNLINTMNAFARGVKRFGQPPNDVGNELHEVDKSFHAIVRT